MADTREHIGVELLYEEDGVGWFESADQKHSIDIPMHYLGEGPDGDPREFRVTDKSRCFITYEENGGVTFMAEEGDQLAYIRTKPTELGFEIADLHIFKKYTTQ